MVTYSWQPSELTPLNFFARYFCLTTEIICIITQLLILKTVIKQKIKITLQLGLNLIVLTFDFLFCMVVVVWTIWSQIKGQSKIICQVQGLFLNFSLFSFVFSIFALSLYKYLTVIDYQLLDDYCWIIGYIIIIVVTIVLLIISFFKEWFAVTPSSYCMLDPRIGLAPRILLGFFLTFGVALVFLTVFNYLSIMNISQKLVRIKHTRECKPEECNCIKESQLNRRRVIIKGCLVTLLYSVTILPILIVGWYMVIWNVEPIQPIHIYASANVSLFGLINLFTTLTLNCNLRRGVFNVSLK